MIEAAIAAGLALGLAWKVPDLVDRGIVAFLEWRRERSARVASLYWVDVGEGRRALGVEVLEGHEKAVLEALEGGAEVHGLNRENER